MENLSKKTSTVIWTIVSIIFAVIYTVVCENLNVYQNTLYIERTIIVFAIVEFIGLHIIFGIKRLWNFIIDNRYIIALIMLALFTVLKISGSSMGAVTNWILEPEKNNTILGTYRFIRSDEYGVDTLLTASQLKNGFNQISNLIRNDKTDMFLTIYVPIKSILSLFRIYNIGYVIPNFDLSYSFSGSFKLIASLLITYEFFLIVTNKKKYLSLIGTILVIVSPFISWWFREAIEIIAFGELAIIALNKFMLSKNKKEKLVWSFCLAYSITSYILVLYPAWQISFGYIFLALAIWVIAKNKKEYKLEKIDIAYFIGIIAFICIFVLYFYNICYEGIQGLVNTAYPGARNEHGGKGISFLFEYVYSFKLPFVQNTNTMEFANFISFFPIPLILGIVYLYKKEKHVDFILPICIILVIESVWVMSGFPDMLAKLTLFNLVPVERCAVAVGLGTVYLMIYILANIDEKFIKQTHSIYIVLILLVLLYFMPVPNTLNTKGNLYLFVSVEALGAFLLLNFADERYKKIFLGVAVILSLISSLTVNPIVKGTNPITKTDFAKVVQEEVSKDKEGLWITENMDMVVSNYLVAQGAKTLNATQTYPSEEFWKNVLGENVQNYREIWNRYAHIKVKIIEEGSSYVQEISDDHIELYLTTGKLEELNVKYIVSYNDNLLPEANLNKIYMKNNDENINIEGENVSGIYIYQFVK